TKPITSPTFVLMKIYKLPKPIHGIAQLCHIDCYRLGSSGELAAIGAGEYIGSGDTLTLIEWPERVSSIIPGDAIRIIFQHGI
ncbi:MAG: tRNA (adenosine(37)-N6)-threonylcarbamoyltransferase complex ATPase subunit type 1 TsaE, partial [Patescibacteria group bacterium]